jgi:hypothetical protein
MTLVISLSLISIAGRMYAGPASLPALVTDATVASAAPCMEMWDGVNVDRATLWGKPAFLVISMR